MSDGCARREERLVSLLYGDGDPEELAEIRAHLATCAECRGEFEKLMSTRDLLGAWPNVVNAPSVVYVDEAAGSAGRARRSVAGIGRDFLGSLLPSLAAAALVVLVIAASAPFVRFQVGTDGRLHMGLGASPAAAAEAGALATRSDLDQGLNHTVDYLETLVRTTREQDRQAILAIVDQAFHDQNTAMGQQVANTVNAAFDELDQRRRADLGVMLSAMDDLQVITGTELQRMNAMLASLTPGSSDEQE